jgi:hypothetical protein
MCKYFIAIFILSLTQFTTAAESHSSTSYSQFTSSESMTNTADWSLKMGLGHFELTSYPDSGKMISLELQRKLSSNFYLGGSYTSYSSNKVETEQYAYYSGNGNKNIEALGISFETHPIQVELPLTTQFFAAVTGGIIQELQRAEGIGTYYVSLGIGINYNDQIGIRADTRADRYAKSYNTLSLVGYY